MDITNKKQVIKKNAIKLSGVDMAFMIFVWVVLALFFLSELYPLYFIVVASFSDPLAVSNGQTMLVPVKPSLDGYKYVLNYTVIWTGYANTIFYTVVGTAFNLFLTLPAGYALSRRDLNPAGSFYAAVNHIFKSFVLKLFVVGVEVDAEFVFSAVIDIFFFHFIDKKIADAVAVNFSYVFNRLLRKGNENHVPDAVDAVYRVIKRADYVIRTVVVFNLNNGRHGVADADRQVFLNRRDFRVFIFFDIRAVSDFKL